MKEEKTIEEMLRDMRISKDDPKALKRKIEELEKETKELKQRPNIISGNDEKIYGELLNLYENNRMDEAEYYDEQGSIDRYKRKLGKKLMDMDNINEKVIQRISDYIGKKQIFEDSDSIEFDKAGIFLTTLIEISPLIEITLESNGLSDIGCFAYGLARKKKIIVYGDLGHVGSYMKAGKLEINGNVFSGCGHEMTGGSIEIKGYTRNEVGSFMGGGKIVVHGKGKSKAGALMKGGIIEIKGDVDGECGNSMEGGAIEIDGSVNGNVATAMENGRIHIKGDVNGKSCGNSMEGGAIEIDGNANYNVATAMENGRIHIKGDVNGSCGNRMEGGEVEVDGSVYNAIAKRMKSGTIRINGDKKPELYMKKRWFSGEYKITKKGGSVYHKDKLLE